MTTSVGDQVDPVTVERDRLPMWLAVAITVVVSLPFGLWLGAYSLPLVTLGVFFTGAWLSAAPAGLDPVLEPAVAAVGAALAGLLGCFLGWFNVLILFRRPTFAQPPKASGVRP